MGQLLRRSRHERVLALQSEMSCVTFLIGTKKDELLNPPLRNEMLAEIDDANKQIKRCLEMYK